MNNRTAEEVRNEAAEISDYGGTIAGEMLLELAERIEADEMAVPACWSLVFQENIGVNATTTFSTEKSANDYADKCGKPDVCSPNPTRPRVVPLFICPPAQAAQVDAVTEFYTDRNRGGWAHPRNETARAPTAEPVAQGEAATFDHKQIIYIKQASGYHLRDGTGASDALYNLAVKHGASETEAAGFAHHVNGAMNELQGCVYSMATVAEHAAQPRAMPDAIVELSECRQRGWNDSAPAYRAGWNDCRDAYFAAQRDASEINHIMLATLTPSKT